MKKSVYTFKMIVCMLVCLVSTGLHAQINTPSGAIIPFGSNKSYPYGILPSNLPKSGSYGQATDAANAYTTWKNNYVVACDGGKFRVKFDDPNQTVSEGIAYGMLLSAYAADKALFDGLWAYYKANTNGNVMHWIINGCSQVAEANGATDAELDAALALLVAESQWPLYTAPYDYNAEAVDLINKIENSEMDKANFQASNGDKWDPNADCRNPSYQSPAYYKVFASIIPAKATFWGTNCVDGAYKLIQGNANINTGLVSDWANKAGSTNACQKNSVSGRYGFDACRNPWRMATDVIWFNDAKGAAQCVKIANYVASKGAINVGGPVNQAGGDGGHISTFVSTFATGIIGSPATNQKLLDDMYSQTVGISDPYQNAKPSGYFGNTLRCLSLFFMSGNFWKPGTSLEQEINIQQAGINIPTGGTIDLGNVQQSQSGTFTFTIQNLGTQSNLTVTPPITVTGTDAGKFTVTTQPAGTVNKNGTTTFVVTFTPGAGQTGVGTFTADLTIKNNDTNEGTYVIKVLAKGTLNATAPEVDVQLGGLSIPAGNAPAFSVGNITQSTTTQSVSGFYTFTVLNTGTAPLTVTAATTSTGFTIVTPPATPVAAGGKTTFTVSILAPTTISTRTGLVTLTTNDDNEKTYVLNLTSNIVACATTLAGSNILNDYEANQNMMFTLNATNQLVKPKGAFSTEASNPSVDEINPTVRAAKYTRAKANGTYDQIRYKTCGATFDVTTIPGISLLIYSPRPGVPIVLSAKKADGASPVNPDYSSDLKATTTKTGAWEKLFFDLSGLDKTIPTAYFDILIDPLLASMNAASATTMDFYIDEIKYETPPCITTLPSSQVFMDYDANRNVSFLWATEGSTLEEAVANPSKVSPNTSNTVAKFTRSATGSYKGWRYSGCQKKIDLTNKSVISVLVYSSAANIPINMTLQTATETTSGSAAVKTTKANEWEKLYFDFSGVTNKTTVAYMTIYPDTGAAFAATNVVYYFDDIKYDELPCPAEPTLSATTPLTFCEGGSVKLTATTALVAPVYTWKINAEVIPNADKATYPATLPGEYTVTVTKRNCNLSSASKTVVVNANPPVPVISVNDQSTSICEGKSVTLTSSAATGNQWINNTQSILTATSSTYNATAQGEYQVKVTDANGCSATSVITGVNVTPALPATIQISASVSKVCPGMSVTFSSEVTNAGTIPAYKWKVNGTTKGIEANYTSSLNAGEVVECELTSNLACVTGSPVSSNKITILAASDPACLPTGFSNAADAHAIAVSPNPANGLFTVSFNQNTSGLVKLKVRNVTGEVVFSETSNASKQHELNIQHLPSGIYILEIETSNGVSTERLIKQ